MATSRRSATPSTADVASFTNEPLPSNWHKLDGALAVPFIPAQRRTDCSGFLRSVSYQLEANRQQLDGSGRSRPRRSARSVLEPVAWRSATERSIARPPPADRQPEPERMVDIVLRSATRLAIASVPCQGGEGRMRPVGPCPELWAGAGPLAEACASSAGRPTRPRHSPRLIPCCRSGRRRHSFLLWQAERATKEGWAEVARTSPDGWYCRKVAATLIGSAEGAIRENAADLTGRPAENLSPDELDRWLAECKDRERSADLWNWYSRPTPPAKSRTSPSGPSPSR